MASQRCKPRRRLGRAQLARSCNLERYTKPRLLPAELLDEALSLLSRAQRSWLLARCEHFERYHPPEPMDDRTEAVVSALDTAEFRIETATHCLAHGAEEGLEPWQIADAVLDMNQEQSTIIRRLLAQHVTEEALAARQVVASVEGISPDSVELDPVFESGRLWFDRRN